MALQKITLQILSKTALSLGIVLMALSLDRVSSQPLPHGESYKF